MKYKIDSDKDWKKHNLETTFDGTFDDAVAFLAKFAESKWKAIANGRSFFRFPRMMFFYLWDESGHIVHTIGISAIVSTTKPKPGEWHGHNERLYSVWHTNPKTKKVENLVHNQILPVHAYNPTR